MSELNATEPFFFEFLGFAIYNSTVKQRKAAWQASKATKGRQISPVEFVSARKSDICRVKIMVYLVAWYLPATF